MLRRRIKSVQSTKKITKAMELIAASRILKAQQRVNAARPYSEQITEVIEQLSIGRDDVDRLVTFDEFNQLVDLDGHYEREARFDEP